MGVPVTVAMGNAYYVFFCAHGNSHAHAHAYSHGHAHDYVHGHVYYWQTCGLVGPQTCTVLLNIKMKRTRWVGRARGGRVGSESRLSPNYT